MRRALRILPPAAAVLLALLAVAAPVLPRRAALPDVLVVVDITRSMTVRDMAGTSRLDYARGLLGAWIAQRPCGSRVALGIFTERRSLTLFEPLEVCADYASLIGALEGLNWRMAWEGDSLISRGVNHALARAAALGAGLLFVTDGHEAPPLPYDGPTDFRGESPGGVILGLGGTAPAPIPKYDDLGREDGFYAAEDLQQVPARFGAPPADAADRPGYHPRNNPYGEGDPEGSEHLSRRQDGYLAGLSTPRGLTYLTAEASPRRIESALQQAILLPPREVQTSQNIAPFFGLLGAALMSGLWLAGLLSPNTIRKT